MNPAMSLKNFVPSSTALLSAADGTAGTLAERQRLVHGHAPATIDTVIPAPAPSTFPLSSNARERMFAVPGEPADHSYVHTPEVWRLAVCHVAPLSTDTSTPATVPPPFSTAVPLIDTRVPLSPDDPAAGDTIVDVGAKMSADIEAVTSGRLGLAPVCNVRGCAPMSASRFTVACCIA